MSVLLGRGFILSLVACLVGCKEDSSSLRSRPVVRVNNVSLSAGELSDQLAYRLQEFHILSARDSAIIAQAKNTIVQDFIVRVVTESWAQANQLFVRKEELAKEILKTKTSYPDEIAFRKALANEGLTYSEWEDRVRFSVLERLVLSDLSKSVSKPTAKEISDFYTANKAQFQRSAAVRIRQIVTDSEHSAERVRKELQQGKKFSELAKKYSLTPEATKGGDTGWIEKGVSSVYDTAFKMAKGQRSSIVKSSYGFHIFEVIDKRTAKAMSLAEATPLIERQIAEAREQAVYASWLEEQILKAQVFKDDALLSGLQVFSRSDK